MIGNRPDRGAFIPACLDDYPLNPNEFRVYAHIMRRAGTRTGTHYESVPNTAKCCRMNAKTARNAIKILKALRLIVVHERAGQSSEIEPTHEDDWAPADHVEEIRNHTLKTPTKSGRGTKSGTTKSGRGTPTKSGTPPLPNQVGLPLPNLVDKGTPLKVLPEGTPLKVPRDGTEAMFFSFPWKESGKVDPGFIEWLSEQMSTDGRMHPKTMARNHLLNCERACEFEKLTGYWDDYLSSQSPGQDKAPEKTAYEIIQARKRR